MLKFRPLRYRSRVIRIPSAPFQAGLLVLLPLTAQLRAASDDDVAYFEKHIRPVLVEHCYECHGPGDALRDYSELTMVQAESARIRSGIDSEQFPIGTGPKPSRAERDRLIEETTSAHRERGPDGRVRAHPAWHDLDEAGRRQAFEAALLQRRLEAACDPDGLSGTARAVLARLRAAQP